MTAFFAVGTFLIIAGFLMRPRTRPGELRTQGTVIESRSGWALGQPTWLCTVEFRDNAGATWRFQPRLTAARPRSIGTAVEVAYLPTNPSESARRTDGLDGRLHWVVAGAGGIVLVAALLARVS